jgi:hypothetical protein
MEMTRYDFNGIRVKMFDYVIFNQSEYDLQDFILFYLQKNKVSLMELKEIVEQRINEINIKKYKKSNLYNLIVINKELTVSYRLKYLIKVQYGL